MKTFQRYCVYLMNQCVFISLTAVLCICRINKSRNICTVIKNYMYYIINIYFSMSERGVHWIIWCFSPCFSLWVHEKNIFCRIWGFLSIMYSGTGLLVFIPCHFVMKDTGSSASFINKTTRHDMPEDCHLNCTSDCRHCMYGSGIYTKWKVKAGQGMPRSRSY
jgi:hypothetical protein